MQKYLQSAVCNSKVLVLFILEIKLFLMKMPKKKLL